MQEKFFNWLEVAKEDLPTWNRTVGERWAALDPAVREQYEQIAGAAPSKIPNSFSSNPLKFLELGKAERIENANSRRALIANRRDIIKKAVRICYSCFVSYHD